VEIPDVCAALAAMPGLDPSIDLDKAIFFGTRDHLVHRPGASTFPAWRLPIFAFLYLNAIKMVDRFNLPSKNVVEIGRQIEI
jgi:KUP system potassium uptake protein